MPLSSVRLRLSKEEARIIELYRSGGLLLPDRSLQMPEFEIPGSDANPGPKFLKIGACRALVVGDIHAPYHDVAALKLAFAEAFHFGVDTIILNGDISDFYGISRFEKNPDKRSFAGEIEVVRRLLAALRKAFPDARIIYKVGNHEDRWHRWLLTEAAQLKGLEELELASLLRLKDHGIEYVESADGVRLGKLHVLHGHEIPGGGTINPARNILLKQFSSIMVNHWHVHDTKQHTGLNGEQHQAWVNGCMCGLSPDYSRRNQWSQGFALVEVEGDGSFRVHHRRIRNGRVE